MLAVVVGLAGLVLILMAPVWPALADKGSPAAPRLTSILSDTGAVVEVRWSGVTSLAYVVQASTGLVGAVWVPLGTNTYRGGGFLFSDEDAANLDGRFYRVAWMVDTNDTIGPTWPGGSPVSVSGETPGSVLLTWVACPDDTGIACYGIYLGDRLVAAAPGGTTSVVVNGLGPGQEYVFTVEACDVGGNVTTTGPDITTHTRLQPEPARNPSLGIDSSDNPGSLLLHSGEYIKRRTDMTVRGRRAGFAFSRTYRSNREESGPLGYGWDANVFARVEEQPDGDVLWFPGDGRAFRFGKRPGNRYESPPGIYAKLKAGDTGLVLRTPAGTKYYFDTQGRIATRRDRIGNTLQYRYTVSRLSSVIDEFGREITFAYDGSERLASITDFTGRQVVYTYDAHGNLVAVRSPIVTGTPHGNDFPAGKTERYEYDIANPDPHLAHNMVQVIAPNEVADGSLTARELMAYGQAGNDYDRVLFREVGGKSASGVNAGGTLAYVYDLAPAGAPAGTVSRTTVTDRNNNVCEYYHDAAGRCLRAIDDPNGISAVHTMAYNGHGELVERTLPEGNRRVYEYDAANADRFQQGNLLSLTRFPDAVRGGDQARIRISYTYEPLCNRVLTRTGPRGNDPAYVPPNGGAWSVSRYTATYTYDYQEAATAPPEATEWDITVPPALLNKGDANDDGRTNQAMGNRIRCDGPTVNLPAGSNQALAEGDTQQEVVTRWSYNDFGQRTRAEDPRGNINTFSYYPESDPDGDGHDPIAGRDNSTGGYRSGQVTDAVAGPRRQDAYDPAAAANAYTYDRRGNIVVRTDGRGNEWRGTYNQLDQLVQTEAPRVDAGQAHGYLRRTSFDANNNVVTTSVENVTTATDHLPVAGTPAWFQYSADYDILGSVIETTRDARRDPVIPASAQPELLTTQYEYDGNRNLVRIRSPLAVAGTDTNNAVRYTYDRLDRRVAVRRGEGSAEESTWTYAYDANGNRIGWTDGEDNDATPGPESETYTYDGYDRRVGITLRDGSTQSAAFDPAGLRVRQEFRGPAQSGGSNVLLAARDYLHDEGGRPFQVDRELFLPAGVTLSNAAATLVDGPLTPGDSRVSRRYEYDALGRRTYRVEDTAAVYSFKYDGANRLREVRLPLVDNTTPGGPYFTQEAFTYDANNNRIRSDVTHANPGGSQPLELTTHYVYDALNRMVRTTRPMGRTDYNEYDSRGNLVATYDARADEISDPLGVYTNGDINTYGNPVRYAYDGMGRCWLTQIELLEYAYGGQPPETNAYNPDGLVSLLAEYDANSRIDARSDDNGNTTRYTYDSLNRLVRHTNADGGVRTMTYSGDHDLIGMVDENGTQHTFVRSALGKMMGHTLVPAPGKTIPGTSLPMLVGTRSRAFKYDGLSRLVECIDRNEPGDADDDWGVHLKYDSLGRLVEDVQNGFAVTSGYEADNRVELHYPGSDRIVHRGHDAHGQITGISNATVFTVIREVLGVLDCVPRSVALNTDAAVIEHEYGPCGCPMSATCTAGGKGIGTHTLDRDRNSSVFVVDRMLTGDGPGGFHQERRTDLNSNNALTSESLLQEAGIAGWSWLSQEFSLDGANVPRMWTAELQGSAGGYSRTNRTDSHSMYESPRKHDEDRFFNASPGTGLRTKDGRFIYQYDGLNRLRVVRSVADSNVVARYAYDATPFVFGGRRVEKRVTNAAPHDGTTRFYWDRMHTIEERTVTGSVERLSQQYVYGGMMDEVLVTDRDTDADGVLDRLYFLMRDYNNNVIHLVSNTGTNRESYLYGMYGIPTVHDGQTLAELGHFSPAGNPYLFAGRRYEPETGLYYYRARYYDPRGGEFLTRDPLGVWGDARSIGNPMAYVAHNPWNSRDPSGLNEDDWRIYYGSSGGPGIEYTYDDEGRLCARTATPAVGPPMGSPSEEDPGPEPPPVPGPGGPGSPSLPDSGQDPPPAIPHTFSSGFPSGTLLLPAIGGDHQYKLWSRWALDKEEEEERENPPCVGVYGDNSYYGADWYEYPATEHYLRPPHTRDDYCKDAVYGGNCNCGKRHAMDQCEAVWVEDDAESWNTVGGQFRVILEEGGKGLDELDEWFGPDDEDAGNE